VATLVAVLGLLITLIFNTVGVWGQLEQAEKDAKQAKLEATRAHESRLYTQIGVLTQLARDARASQRVIDETMALPNLRCRADYHGSDIGFRDEAILREALAVYDFMAWLFNDGYMPSQATMPIWAPRMVGAAQLGEKLTSLPELRADFPQLAKFYAKVDKKYAPPSPCPRKPPDPGG
jgi:hypothetical protein